MQDNNGYFRQFNQCLYFSRLQTDIADTLYKEEAKSFNAQQLQCHCEASVECLYRALYFLASSQLKEPNQHYLLSNPATLIPVLDEANNQQPAAALQELVSALKPHLGKGSYDLSGLITAYAALWQPQKKIAQTTASLLSVREIHITAEQCREWHKQLSEIANNLIEHSAEY